MAGYFKGSKKLLEKLETDIAFDLDKLASMAGPQGKAIADRINDKLELIHDEYSAKWAAMSKVDQDYHDPSNK